MTNLTSPELWPLDATAAIFDFDGTIASTGDLWVEVDRAFLSRRGLEYDPSFSIEMAALGFTDGAQYCIDHFGLDETVQGICDEWNRMGAEFYASCVELRSGAEAYIRALKDHGIKIALATTNAREVIDSTMPRVDIDGLFDVRVHGAEVPRSKHHPDIYLEAAHRLGVSPRDCVVFEDIEPAVRSASRAGCTVCGVRSDDPSQDEKSLREQSDLWVESWTDIPVPR